MKRISILAIVLGVILASCQNDDVLPTVSPVVSETTEPHTKETVVVKPVRPGKPELVQEAIL